MNKKVIPFLALALAATTLTACGGSGADKKVKDVFIYNFSDTYITSVRDSMKALDKELNFLDGNNTQETQTAQIKASITKGADVLMINTVETGSGENLAKEAKKADIPAIFFNREVKDAAVMGYDKACFIGTDPDEAGYMQGRLIAEEILANPTKWDKDNNKVINYTMFRAELDNPEANGRTTYSVQQAKEILEPQGYTLKQISSDQMCSWSADKAKNAMKTILQVNPMDGNDDIEVVFANNDEMAIGAINALKEAGYNKENSEDYSKKVLVAGVDATAAAQDLINKGAMFGSVKQDGEAMAKAIVTIANNAVKDGFKGGDDFIAGTEYKWSTSLEDKTSTVRKIRIPYAIFKK